MDRQENLLYNSIPKQQLTYTNQLTFRQWNDIVNILSTQTNSMTTYIKQLHSWLCDLENPDNWYDTVNTNLQTLNAWKIIIDEKINTLDNIIDGLDTSINTIDEIVQENRGRIISIENIISDNASSDNKLIDKAYVDNTHNEINERITSEINIITGQISDIENEIDDLTTDDIIVGDDLETDYEGATMTETIVGLNSKINDCEQSYNKTNIIDHLSTEEEYPNAKAVYDLTQNIREIAEGKNKALCGVLTTPTQSAYDLARMYDGSTKPLFNNVIFINSQFNSMDTNLTILTSDTGKTYLFYDYYVKVLYKLSDIKKGDVIFLENINIPDRWFAGAVDNNYSFSVLETKTIVPSLEKPYLSLERLGAYLYSVSFDTIPNEIDLDVSVGGACTSFIKDGKLYRNLDWNYDNVAEFKVTTKNFKGMAMIPTLQDGDLDDTLIGQLPYHINDGINNDGIMVSSHVLFNDWEYDGAGSKNILLTKLPYLILSNLHTMTNISSLQTYLNNIKVNNTLATKEYLMQFLITDGETTYVITPGENGYELVNISNLPKLTNFKWIDEAIITRDNEALQDRPTGIERWNLIENGASLEELKFTNAYKTATRLSEFIGINDTTKDSTDEELEEIYEDARQEYLSRTRNGYTWQTVHSVVYSPKGIISLNTQENYVVNYASNESSSGGMDCEIGQEDQELPSSDLRVGGLFLRRI